MNTPPAKAGGFGLRLKAGLIGHSADCHTTVKSSSGSGGGWLRMYSLHTSSVTFPQISVTSTRADEFLERLRSQGRETLDRTGCLHHFADVDIAARIRPDAMRRDEVAG